MLNTIECSWKEERGNGWPPFRVPRCFRWNGYWACLKGHAPSGAPALAVYPSPASRRPIRTQLQPSRWPPIPPTLHQTLARHAPETHRGTSIPDQRYYGESPVRLRRYERAVGGRRSSHSIENSEKAQELDCFRV